MLIGTYSHQLDQKNRFRIPAKFKQALGEDIIITRGNGKQLFLFAGSDMQRLVIDKAENISLFDEVGQKSVRLLLSSSFELEQDNQGRVLLPTELKNFAGITKDIVSIGVGSRVEIWAKEEWEAYSKVAEVDKELSNLKDYGV